MDINWIVAWSITLLMVFLYLFFTKGVSIKYLEISLVTCTFLFFYFFKFNDVVVDGYNISSNIYSFFAAVCIIDVFRCRRKPEE